MPEAGRAGGMAKVGGWGAIVFDRVVVVWCGWVVQDGCVGEWDRMFREKWGNNNMIELALICVG